MQKSNIWLLARFVIKRNKFLLMVWFALPVLLIISTIASFTGLFSAPEAVNEMVRDSMSNNVIVGMHGPILDSSLGGITAWRQRVMLVLFVGIFSMVFINKNTRKEEESGRYMLLGANVVGHNTLLNVNLIIAFITNLLAGIFVAIGAIGMGLEATGSFSLGLSIASGGCFMAALTSLVAQLTESASKVNMWVITILGLFFILNFASNLNPDNDFIAWLSPFTWTIVARPYAGETWLILIYAIAVTAVLTCLSYYFHGKRDSGAAIFGISSGKPHASPGFRNPMALGWRLHKGIFSGWLVGFSLIAVLLGGVAKGMVRLVGDNPQMLEWMEKFGGDDNAFVAVILYVISLNLSAYIILSVSKLRIEETNGLAQLLLSTPVKRMQWLFSHLVYALLGSLVILLVFGFLTGLIHGLNTGDVGYQVSTLVGQAMAKVPAVWVVAGISLLLFGWLPKFSTAISWTLFAAFILLELFWETGNVSDTLFALSPFSHVHPIQNITIFTMAGLLSFSLLTLFLGMIGFQRRDLE
ncbi:MAG: hypothetical protein VB074_16095 [Proteiniphilum sp.]|jgi:ABC-2 type transport system permease protein|uniref:ABC transporter permease n=1 Tax=Proteiniphilum sp. TaxID=1926877 RepID=UPI002B1F1852|nr:hypothetical protein [Proteiniphilum sp.]MEA5129698.1 hypothetical protein [Proteiniphilum sp.]